MTKNRLLQELNEFQAIMREILISKGSDYSNNDVLSNFKLSGMLSNQDGSKVALNQINIKITRLNNLIFNSKEIKHESIEDSIIDLANYLFLFKCLIGEEKEDS